MEHQVTADQVISTVENSNGSHTAVLEETETVSQPRDRVKAAVRRFGRPLADLVERDANEGDTRLLVTDFLCDGLGFDKYEDLTTEYQVKGQGCFKIVRAFGDAGVTDDAPVTGGGR